jgi:chromosome segregation ATPase
MMKVLFFVVVVVLAMTASLVQGDECEHICNERNAEIMKVKDEVWHSREEISREKDEIWHHRELVIKEKDELWHSREEIVKEKDELWHRSEQLGREVHDLRLELEQVILARDEAHRALEASHAGGDRVQELENIIESQKVDIEQHQKISQENQKFMVDYKVQLASQRDRAAQLDSALKDATAKIFELEHRSLGQHLTSGWQAVVGLVTGNKATTEGEF